MYNLVTMKGITVPEGYSRGLMGEGDAALYLMELGLRDDAFLLLDTLKAVVVPENTQVLTTRGGKNITIDEGKGVPIHIGGNNDWDEFKAFVEDPDRNADGRWQIQEKDEDSNKWVDLGEASAEDTEDGLRARMSLYREAIGVAVQNEDIASAFTLLKEAIKEAEYTGEEEYSEAVATNLKVRLGNAFNSLVAHVFGKSHATDRPNSSISDVATKDKLAELRVSIRENLRASQQEIANSLAGEMEGYSWDVTYDEVSLPKEFTTFGRISPGRRGTDAFAAGKEDPTVRKKALILTRRETEGVTDVSALAAFLTISPNDYSADEINALLEDTGKGYEQFPLEKIGIDSSSRGINTQSSKSHEQIDTDPMDLAANILIRRPNTHYGKERIAYRAELRSEKGRGAPPGVHYNILGQINDLEGFIDEYYEESPEEVRAELYSRGFFTNMWDGGTATMAKESYYISSTSTSLTNPLDNLALRMTLAFKREGHRFMFDHTNSEDQKTINNLLGNQENLTQRLDNLLTDQTRIPKMKEKNEEFSTKLGQVVADEFGVVMTMPQHLHLGNSLMDVYERALNRNEFGHGSILARLGASYISSDPHYQLGFSRLVEYLCGPDATFDSYSQTFTGDGRTVPLAAMTYLSANYAKIMGDKPFQQNSNSKNGTLERLMDVIRSRGQGYSSEKLHREISKSVRPGINVVSRVPGALGSRYTGMQYDSMEKIFGNADLKDMTEIASDAPATKKQAAFERVIGKWQEGIQKMNLPEGAADKLIAFARGRIDPTGKGQTLGAFLEPGQMISTVAGLLKQYSGTGFEINQGTMEYKNFQLNPSKNLSRIDRMTFVDGKGRSHIIVPNVSNTGAVDMTHFRVDGKTMDIVPHEYKLSANEHALAHISKTKNLGLVVSAVMGANPGVNRVNTHCTVNSSIRVPEDGDVSVQVNNKQRYVEEGSYITRSGPTSIPAGTEARRVSVYNDLRALEARAEEAVVDNLKENKNLTDEQRRQYANENLSMIVEGKYLSRKTDRLSEELNDRSRESDE